MSKSKSKPKYTNKAYLKRVYDGKLTVEDKLYSLLHAIEIVLYRIGEYQRDEELKENAGRMFEKALRIKTADMKPVPELTGDYRYSLSKLRHWVKNPYEKQQQAPANTHSDDFRIVWSDDDPAYIPLSSAIKMSVNLKDSKRIGKLLKPNWLVRYMRKGRRCKVHSQDWMALDKAINRYAANKSNKDRMFDLLDDYVEDTRREQDKIRKEKQARGEQPVKF